MINIFVELQNNLDKLSNYEQIIAKYILQHPQQVLSMNAKELSMKCAVSQATVYRLCDKLGISGFSELKIKISAYMDDYLKNNQEFDFDFPIKQFQTHYEIIGKIKEDYQKTINITADMFNLDELRLVITEMKKAKQVDIYTSAGNIYFALNFKFQMQEIGVNVNVPIDEYQQRLLAASGDNNHFAIIISFQGRGILSNILPKILKEKQTKMLLISAYGYNFKNFDPDYHLFINNHENHYKKISSFSTRLSILFILDVLYTCYFKMNYDENVNKKVAYYDLISKYNDTNS